MAMALDQLQDLIDEEPPQQRSVGGSREDKMANVDRDRVIMDAQMYKYYFANYPTHGPSKFRRRYRMRRSLFCFMRVFARDDYSEQRRDACGFIGLSSRQKITAALRMLTLGVCVNAQDDYSRTSETTAMECMRRFLYCSAGGVWRVPFEEPTYEDYQQQLQIDEARGFPDMFGSLNCMHYEWKNCPVAWHGDYGDKDGKQSIILEAVADQRLHIWQIYFGLPSLNNDVNVLNRSPLINDLVSGAGCDMTFEINGQEYNRYYLLADSIYP